MDVSRWTMNKDSHQKKNMTKRISEVSRKTGYKTMKLVAGIFIKIMILDLLLPSMLDYKKTTPPNKQKNPKKQWSATHYHWQVKLVVTVKLSWYNMCITIKAGRILLPLTSFHLLPTEKGSFLSSLSSFHSINRKVHNEPLYNPWVKAAWGNGSKISTFFPMHKIIIYIKTLYLTIPF